MPKKKRNKWIKKSFPYFSFGVVNKTTFYYIYVGWWTFLGILAVSSYVMQGDALELANVINNLDSPINQEEIKALELKIAVLEQELRNAGVIQDNISAKEFILRENNKQLHTFLSVSIFFSVIIFKLYFNYFE